MYAFGSGQLFGKRTDITNPTPTQFGVLQDVEIDIDRTLKELYGQNQFPVAIGAGQMKVTGKAKFAQISMQAFTGLFFSGSQTTGRTEFTPLGELNTVPAVTTYTITVTNSATFKLDEGVFYAATGIQFTRVASGPTIGQYSVNEATGVYTFAAADASASVRIYYQYTITTGKSLIITNPLQGNAPTFSMVLRNSYPAGAINEQAYVLTLNQCIGSKLALPSKQGDFTIQEFDFSCFADAAGNIGTIGTDS